MSLLRHATAGLSCLAALAAAAGATQPPDVAAPPARHDLLGRPIQWGDDVDGQSLSLWMPCTRLLHGQPIELRLEASYANVPPYLRVRLSGPRQTAFVELTTADGEPVTIIPPPTDWGVFRLRPTGRFARGPYLVPGEYSVRVVVQAKRDPSDPIAWAGRVESNVIEFAVLDTGDGRERVPEPRCARARELVEALAAEDDQARARASRELLALGLDALPVLEEALGSPSPEVRAGARDVLVTLTEPLFETHSPFDHGAAAACLALLGDPAWDALGAGMPPDRLEYWRMEAARFAAAPVLESRDPLPQEVVRRLVAGLTSASPRTRLITMRTVPPTRNKAVLDALVGLLDDPYLVQPAVLLPCCPHRVHLVADETRRHGISWRGSAVVASLLDFARGHDEAELRKQVVELLEELPPDPRILEFAREVLTDEAGPRLAAIRLLGRQGPAAAEYLLRVAEDDDEPESLRLLAIEEFPGEPDLERAGGVLADILKSRNAQWVRNAVIVANRLGVSELAPTLKRLALDESAEQNVRAASIAAYRRLADPEQARLVLLELLDSPSRTARGQALVGLGALECLDCAPRLLKALSDSEWYVRAQADNALRGVFAKPEGVGYEPGQPDPSLWVDWCAARE